MSTYITKSSLMSGLKCQKLLWLKANRSDLAVKDTAPSMSAAAGTELGQLARKNYPDGILVEHVREPDKAVIKTSRLIASASPVPLFEAAFSHDGVLARADILVPVGNGWKMIEVKSASGVKDHYLVDCAIQLWVLENAGIRVNQVAVAHVDTSFEYTGGGNYVGLLAERGVTEEVRDLLPEVPVWIGRHRSVLGGAMPIVRMGSQCKPECSFTGYCEEVLPEFPVSLLPNAAKAISELHKAGIEDVRDIPAGRLKSERHIRVWQVTRDNAPYISPTISSELASLPFPRYYVDFETINLAIPRWAGTRPYQQVPFQWSCHVEHQNGEIEHKEYLEVDGEPPMRPFAESLIDAVGDHGPIIVYGTHEETILKQEILFVHDLEDPLRSIIDRLVNLLPMMRDHYYHPLMKGSWSIKDVLPTVASHLDYSQLEEVKNGTMAQAVYLEIINPGIEQEERQSKIRNLLKYCELDTLAMLELVKFFEK